VLPVHQRSARQIAPKIERRRELGESPFEAASKGASQIAFAATAATLSIAVVFIPTVFVKGIVGSFLGEFGVAVASAVLISLVVALTLTPMLAARMPPPAERAHGSIYHRLERGFEWLDRAYRRTLDWVREVERRGAGEIVLNCMNQDGVRKGYDVPQLAAVRAVSRIPLIASGGAGALEHFKEVFEVARVDGALAASVFHSAAIDIRDLKRYLAAAGIAIRPAA